MKNTATKMILRQHSVGTRERGGKLEAIEIFTTPDLSVVTEWVDVTNMNKAQLLAWLGY